VKAGQLLNIRHGPGIFEVRVEGLLRRIPGVDPRQTVLLADRRRLEAAATYGMPLSLPPTELRLALPPGASAAVQGALRTSTL